MSRLGLGLCLAGFLCWRYGAQVLRTPTAELQVGVKTATLRPLVGSGGNSDLYISYRLERIIEREKVMIGGRPELRAPNTGLSDFVDPMDPQCGSGPCGTILRNWRVDDWYCYFSPVEDEIVNGASRSSFFIRYTIPARQNFSIIAEFSILNSGADFAVPRHTNATAPISVDEWHSQNFFTANYRVNNFPWTENSHFEYFPMPDGKGGTTYVNNASTLEFWIMRSTSSPTDSKVALDFNTSHSTIRASTTFKEALPSRKTYDVSMRSHTQYIQAFDGVGYYIDPPTSLSTRLYDIASNTRLVQAMRRAFDVGEVARWSNTSITVYMWASARLIPEPASPPTKHKVGFQAWMAVVAVIGALFLLCIILLILTCCGVLHPSGKPTRSNNSAQVEMATPTPDPPQQTFPVTYYK